jgi:hypothetical protein
VEPCASRASCSRVSVAGDAPVTPTPVLQQLLGHLAPRCFDRRGWPVMRLLRSPDRVLVASTGSQLPPMAPPSSMGGAPEAAAGRPHDGTGSAGGRASAAAGGHHCRLRLSPLARSGAQPGTLPWFVQASGRPSGSGSPQWPWAANWLSTHRNVAEFASIQSPRPSSSGRTSAGWCGPRRRAWRTPRPSRGPPRADVTARAREPTGATSRRSRDGPRTTPRCLDRSHVPASPAAGGWHERVQLHSLGLTSLHG